MDCPYCDGKAELVIKKAHRTFRKEMFEVFEHHYKCDTCKKEFTTDEIDTLDVSQIYNQYRERHAIPFPAQLTEVRKKYHLSASKMSDILGLGANQYRLYESGTIPGESQATLLNLIKSSKDFLKVVESKMAILKEKEYEKITAHLQNLIKQEEHAPLRYIDALFNNTINPDQFSGYAIPSFEKFVNMVIYFIKDAPFRVRLNKYLFYADFLNFKKTCSAISGCAYAAITMGPVPDNYDFIFGELVKQGYLGIELEPCNCDNDDMRERYVALKECDTSLFTDAELQTLASIEKRFKNVPTKNIVEQSHKEEGWIEKQKSKGRISYQKFGFMLKN
jgi:transcriptional regulator with XRE-family HTH domain